MILCDLLLIPHTWSQSLSTALPSLFPLITWAMDLSSEVPEDLWEMALSQIHSCSTNTRHRLIQFKVVHRLHYSRTKLNRIYPSVPALCHRCSAAEGTLAHLFWFCPRLFCFWSTIFKWFSKCYRININLDPLLGIFGCSTKSLKFKPDLRSALQLGMVVAKKLILLAWKSVTPPTFDHWLRSMVSNYLL